MPEDQSWSSWEVIDAGQGVITGQLLAGCNGDPAHKIVRAMKLLDLNGFPCSGISYQKVDDRPPTLYVLKGNPSCWRAYFTVDPNRRLILYTWIVCKKTQKRDKGDTEKARRNLDAASSKGATRIQFP